MIPQNGWFIMENPIKNGWFGGTTIFGNTHIGAWFQYGISPSLVPHAMDDHPIIHPLQAILMVYSSCRWHVCRYCIYTWNLETSSILVVESSKTKSFPIKTGVIWVPGICSLQALPMLTTLYPWCICFQDLQFADMFFITSKSKDYFHPTGFKHLNY